MANSSAAGGGFRPVGTRSGAALPAPTPFYVAAASSVAVKIGDAVVTTGTANTTVISVSGNTGSFKGYPIGSLRGVTLATEGAGNKITGIVVGIERNATQPLGSAPMLPDDTSGVVWVQTSPDVVYEVKSDDTNAVTDVDANVDLKYAAGNDYTGRSGSMIDGSSAGSGATKQFHILGVSRDDENNDLSASGCHFLVALNANTDNAQGILVTGS